jgi:hypothetical protein
MPASRRQRHCARPSPVPAGPATHGAPLRRFSASPAKPPSSASPRTPRQTAFMIT